MWKMITAAAIALAPLGAVAGTAHAGPGNEVLYLNDLAERGFIGSASPAASERSAALSAGYSVCNDLSTMPKTLDSTAHEANVIQRLNPGMTYYRARAFVTVAEYDLCPAWGV